MGRPKIGREPLLRAFGASGHEHDYPAGRLKMLTLTVAEFTLGLNDATLSIPLRK